MVTPSGFGNGAELPPPLPLPELTQLGFDSSWLEIIVEIVPGAEYSKGEMLTWQLEKLHAIAADPVSRRESVTVLLDFEASERSDVPASALIDHDTAAEVAEFARSVIANYAELPTLRRVFMRGIKEAIQTTFNDDNEAVAEWFWYSGSEGLAEAILAAVKLAQALYGQETGMEPDFLGPIAQIEIDTLSSPQSRQRLGLSGMISFLRAKRQRNH